MRTQILEEEHLLFEEAFSDFLKKEALPYNDQWEQDGMVSRELWKKAGEQGFLCMEFPEEYGGLGKKDFRFNAIIDEQLAKNRLSGPGFGLHNDIMCPYFMSYFNPDQRKKWMKDIHDGKIITAIAMTEPGTGSDLAGIRTSARKEKGYYLVNGAKTFITNGIMSDLVIVVVRTDSDNKHGGLSLLLVERDMKGFERGKKLDKMGLKAQDTAELFFNDVRVPAENLLGEEGMGFYYLMNNLPQERLSIAVGCVASCEKILELTTDYCQNREAFGKKIGYFQNTRFKLAEMKTETEIARIFVDDCILELNQNKLTNEKAAMAKWWTSELLCRMADESLQMHGGYGYMNEYPISQFYKDARVSRIYGGTNEIMKEIIGRSMIK